jgi:O-acetyl-ADP-ribose deacetylase (regulator of RNase III)
MPLPRPEVLDVDITTLAVDAVANAANAQLVHGGGVAGAIARAAGPALEEESRRCAPIDVGSAVETTAGEMPARWVIHAATMAQPGGTTDAGTVRRCTAAVLAKAEELGARSLALVAFGTGVGGFPIDEAAAIEVGEVRRHLESGGGLQRVVFAVRGPEAAGAFERALAGDRPQRTRKS